jgi:hypothetical protein
MSKRHLRSSKFKFIENYLRRNRIKIASNLQYYMTTKLKLCLIIINYVFHECCKDN